MSILYIYINIEFFWKLKVVKKYCNNCNAFLQEYALQICVEGVGRVAKRCSWKKSGEKWVFFRENFGWFEPFLSWKDRFSHFFMLFFAISDIRIMSSKSLLYFRKCHHFSSLGWCCDVRCILSVFRHSFEMMFGFVRDGPEENRFEKLIKTRTYICQYFCFDKHLKNIEKIRVLRGKSCKSCQQLAAEGSECVTSSFNGNFLA